MPDDKVREIIAEGAEDLNAKLKLGLGKDSLIKTGGYNKHTSKKKLSKLKREKNSLILNYSDAEFEAELGSA